MDNAVAPLAPQTLVPLNVANPSLGARLAALPARSMLGLGVGVALLVAVAVALTLQQATAE